MKYKYYKLSLVILLILLILLKFISLKKKNTIEYFLTNVKLPKKIGIIGDFSHFKNSKLYNLMKNNFEAYNKNNNYNLLLMWEPFEKIDIPNTNIYIINKNLKDISKKGLEKMHKKIFGYNLIVNPTTYNDKFISKANGSNKLGSAKNPHYKLYTNKLKPEQVNKNFIYQKYINNTDDKNNIVDYRVFIFKKKVKYVIKYLVTNQFITRAATSNQKSFVEYEEYFKKSNIIKINQFINELDLEYGELDIIIDKNKKKIYIIDVNNTPSGDYISVGFSHKQTNDIKKYFD